MKNKLHQFILGLALPALFIIGPANAAQSPVEVGVTPRGATPLELYVFDCGKVQARDLSVFNPAIKKGRTMEMSVPCYLIKHPEGSLFWDAGLSDELNKQAGGIEYYDGVFNFSVPKTLKSQMQEIGMTPADVDYLALSHLHVDHIGNANYFDQSTWLVQEIEHSVAFSEQAQDYGFVPADYTKLETAKTIKLNGDYDVFGDGSVVILSTPGHSPGHQVLWVDLPETGAIIISGDLYHFQENRENYGIPVWNEKKSTIHSFARIDNILDRTGAILWIEHDKPQFDSLKKSPQFYQ